MPLSKMCYTLIEKQSVRMEASAMDIVIDLLSTAADLFIDFWINRVLRRRSMRKGRAK